MSYLRPGLHHDHARGVLPSTRRTSAEMYRTHAATAAAESWAALLLAQRSGLSEQHQTFKRAETLAKASQRLLASAGELERTGHIYTHGGKFSNARALFRESANALAAEASTASRIGDDGEAILEGLVHRLQLEQST